MDRARVIDTLRRVGPAHAAVVLDTIGMPDQHERKKALQLMNRMAHQGELAYAKADKGKLRKRYQLPAGS
jgi:hypothetical protein